MRDVHTLILVNASYAALLFAVTWAATRKWPQLGKAAAALVLWVLLAGFEGFYWAMMNIDHFCPRPASPLLVAAHVIYAGLCLLWFAVIVSRRYHGRPKRVGYVVACGLLIAAAITALQWPTQARMSQVCEINLHRQRLALSFYASDHFGRYPDKPGKAWVDCTSSYYTYRTDMLKCPMDRSDGLTSYLLTPQAAGKDVDDMDAKTTVLIENKPRHRGKAHALLANWEVVVVDLKAGKISQK